VAKVFTNAVLPASDLNTNMIQPGTAGSGTRIVAGKTAYSMSATNGINVTISFGFTFSAAPTLIATCQSGSNIDLVLTIVSATTTTGATVRIAEKDGTNVTQSGNIHWLAIGAP
jgi:hypothetical protein